MARVLGIDHYLRSTAETLSGGELRRTQIARAMIGNPKLLIMDEPTTGLDPDGVELVFDHIRSLSECGISAIISTHDTARFAGVCTRAIAIHEGKVVADCPIRTFMEESVDGKDLWTAYRAIEDRL